MSMIEHELREAVDAQPKRGEDRQKYLDRLVELAGKLPDDDWDSLSSEAQEWVNAGIRATNAKKAIPDFEEGENPEETTDMADTEDDNLARAGEEEAGEEGQGRKKSRKAAPKAKSGGSKGSSGKGASKAPAKGEATKTAGKGAAKAPPAKPAKKAAETNGSGGRALALDPGGVKYRIKALMIKNPNVKAEEIIERLSKNGEPPSLLTAKAIRSEFRHSLRVLKDAGRVDIEF